MTATAHPPLHLFLPRRHDMAPSQRFRWEMWEPLLAEHMPVHRHHVEDASQTGDTQSDGWRDHVADVRAMRRQIKRLTADGTLAGANVVIQRRLAKVGLPVLERLLLRAGARRVIFDLDDAIFISVITGGTRLQIAIKAALNYTRMLARRSDLGCCGNGWLADYVRDQGTPAVVVPTTARLQPQRDEPADGPPIVGWSGSRTTAPYLQAIMPQLERLHARSPFRLHVIGGQVQSDAIDVEHIEWTSATQDESVSRLDVGLMPMPHDEWTRGKCALKAILYMAHGIPAVASDFGANREVIADGETGLLCQPDGWADAVGRLLASRDLRRTIGRAGRQVVIDRYTPEAVLPILLDEVLA